MPLLDGKLAGDEGRAAAIALFEDFKQIVARVGIEGFEAPIVENEKIDARERFEKPGVTAVAAGQRQFGEQFRDALIKGLTGCRGRPLWPSAQASQDLPMPVGPQMVRLS